MEEHIDLIKIKLKFIKYQVLCYYHIFIVSLFFELVNKLTYNILLNV
jgi:hypothetical protein